MKQTHDDGDTPLPPIKNIAIIYLGREKVGGTFGLEVYNKDNGNLMRTYNAYENITIVDRITKISIEYKLKGCSIEYYDISVPEPEVNQKKCKGLCNCEEDPFNKEFHYMKEQDVCFHCTHSEIMSVKEAYEVPEGMLPEDEPDQIALMCRHPRRKFLEFVSPEAFCDFVEFDETKNPIESCDCGTDMI